MLLDLVKRFVVLELPDDFEYELAIVLRLGCVLEVVSRCLSDCIQSSIVIEDWPRDPNPASPHIQHLSERWVGITDLFCIQLTVNCQVGVIVQEASIDGPARQLYIYIYICSCVYISCMYNLYIQLPVTLIGV